MKFIHNNTDMVNATPHTHIGKFGCISPKVCPQYFKRFRLGTGVLLEFGIGRVHKIVQFSQYLH